MTIEYIIVRFGRSKLHQDFQFLPSQLLRDISLNIRSENHIRAKEMRFRAANNWL